MAGDGGRGVAGETAVKLHTLVVWEEQGRVLLHSRNKPWVLRFSKS